jgi:ribosomal-protein-alanine N-acetyltransferase
MIVRPATTDDALPIVDLEQLAFDADAWSLPAVVAELGGQDRFTVVAVQDADVVGYAITMRADDVVDLQRIAVHPAHQRRGIAGALLARSLEDARDGGADRMLLEVGATNRAALAFYARTGFVEIDRRRRYYRDGSDALVLRLPLQGGSCD